MDKHISLASLLRLTEGHQKALKRLGIETARDLLYHFPARYESSSPAKTIRELAEGDEAVVFGKVYGLKTKKAWRKKIPMAEGAISDDTGTMKIVWFNQPYLAKMLHEGSLVRLEGKVSSRKEVLYFSNPKVERVEKIPNASENLFGTNAPAHALHPVYPETRGVTSNWLFYGVQKLIQAGALETMEDSLPKELIEKYHLPTLTTALVWVHFPRTQADADAARKRFAFEEVFFIQLEKQGQRKRLEHEDAFAIETEQKDMERFIARFPFKPTEAQHKAIGNILADFSKNHPMARLLEGDVGSGKTFVAAASAYAVVTSRPKGQGFGNLQVAYMAPTEVLARQQFESFIQYFAHIGINVGLITGSGCRKFPSKVNPKGSTDISRAQLLKWVANGEIPVLVGTHALIQKSVRFKHLAYVVIDEQHRFGTAQRQKLVTKERIVPHLLSMTATPIPRTLALTVYGDLDLTLLDEMPAGRKPIITEVVSPEKRQTIYEEIRKQLKAGRQMYVICPRINEPDPTKEMALLAKSVKEEAARLKKDVFPEYEIGVMHSKLKTAEKEKIMEQFKNGGLNILVSTSVIEVGVNVPNATIIVIEGAERFGLSQLHQLRGRVVRSTQQAYCYVFTETKSGTSQARLKALQTARNGFELAEKDLAFRGAGELYGRKQWGITDVAMEALKNIKMVEAARAEARAIVEEDLELKKYPLLKEKLAEKKDIHFE